MKNYILALLAAAFATAPLSAQTLNVKVGDVAYIFNSSSTGVMQYAASQPYAVTIQGKTFATDEILSMTVTDQKAEDNLVAITWQGSHATAEIAGNIANYVAVDISGANVTVTQADNVGDDTCGEITYRLAGESDCGSFLFYGSYKASLELNGLSLTNPAGAAIDIQNGKRINVRVTEGTENYLEDGPGSQKGCLACKGHLEFKQKGKISVTGNQAHAIYAKEYVSIKNSKITVPSAVKDGLNCNQYFAMESGELFISDVGDDAIQVAFKDDTDREAEDTGSITISGGTLRLAATAIAAKALKADGDVLISGGSISASTSGKGKWDADAKKTKGSACISADGNVTIDGGSLSLSSSGSGGKGISSNGTLVINDGEISINTSGGIFAYVNGKEYDGYTGNTDNLNSDYKSSPKGIKCDGDLTVNGGEITIVSTGKGSEGMESKAVLTINDGTISIRSYDDAINSSSHLYIKGGDIEVVATNNDGLDANGNMYISGGVVKAFGASSPECGIDVNEEGGYTLYFTGGVILGVGGRNSVPTKSGSTQAYVSANLSVTAGSTISVGTSAETFYTFDIPADYKSSGSNPFYGPGGGNGGGPGGNNGGGSVIISVPELTSGNSYTITSGSNSTSATARLTGSGGW